MAERDEVAVLHEGTVRPGRVPMPALLPVARRADLGAGWNGGVQVDERPDAGEGSVWRPQ